MTTPWGRFSVEQGSNEDYVMTVGDGGTSTPDFIVDVNGNVGIGSTTPIANLGVGSAAATSTIDMGKPCFRMTTDDGTLLYYWPCIGGSCPTGAVGGWATSTTSCY